MQVPHAVGYDQTHGNAGKLTDLGSSLAQEVDSAEGAQPVPFRLLGRVEHDPDVRATSGRLGESVRAGLVEAWGDDADRLSVDDEVGERTVVSGEDEGSDLGAA